MKIGMLNLHYTYENFGAVLVPFSLGIILDRLGHEVTLIDFQNASYLKAIEKNDLKKWGPDFESFRIENLPKRTDEYFYAKDLKELDDSLDAYIVGSDQIWRYHSDEGIVAFFLEFASHEKVKVSYAASFGQNTWEGNEKQQERIQEALAHFNLITVREDSGINICKDYFNSLAIQVIDPTLLLDKTDYTKLLLNKTSKKVGKDKYLAASILDVDFKTNLIINGFCKKNNLKRINILGQEHFQQDYSYFKYNIKEIVKSLIKFNLRESFFYFKRAIFGKTKIKYNPVSSWLQYIKSSEIVITDSYHCIVFAIIFEKDFLCIMNKRGSDRIKSLFKLLEISEERIISESDKFSRLKDFKPIDYINVNRILIKEKKRCIELLQSGLNSKL
jgi:exopolysaccharide biosynthesis predicted pyruvyltransferase EpsI